MIGKDCRPKAWDVVLRWCLTANSWFGRTDSADSSFVGACRVLEADGCGAVD